MSASFIAVLSLIMLLLGIIYVRIPIAFLLALIGIGGYAMLDGISLAFTMAGNELWSMFSNYGLTVIPFFIFMGQICFHSGLSERLYSSIQAFCGHKKGGLAISTMVACGGFAAICGSNTASAATMSVVALPEMKRYGYKDLLATGTVVAGTTLGAIIPPSVVAIVLGIQTAQSIEQLFLAGLIPGILLLLFFILTIPIILNKNPNWAPIGQKQSWAKRFSQIGGLLEGLFLFALVVISLSFGLFTPTEAGAAGAFAAIIMGLMRKTLSFQKFILALEESLRISTMLILLLATASMFGKFLALTRLPFELASLLTETFLPEPVILLTILLIFILGGMVMDALALLVIAIPIFFPLALAMQWNSLWFSILLIIVTSLGAMTPPVGIAAYIVSNLSGKEEQDKIPLSTVFKGAMLFLPAYLLAIVILILFPSIITFLPEFVFI